MTSSLSNMSDKRKRRNKKELASILANARNIIAEEHRVTLRHLFYRLTALKSLDKTESEYKKLSDYTMTWRRKDLIPWNAFYDSTRYYRGAITYSGLDQALENSKNHYRRDLWQSQDAYVEIWTEKDAIASIATDAASPFGVPVFPMKGFSSGTGLFTIANAIKEQQGIGKKVFVYHLGDHDPSGREIDNSAIRNLRDDFNVEFAFERIAITEEQIKTYNLPTRPTKQSDPRAKNFKGDSVEVDAMSPKLIRNLITASITKHIEPTRWMKEKQIEKMEADTLAHLINAYRSGGVT